MELVTEKLTAKDVSDGYKRTEVGVIPEDWEIFKLEDYTTKIGSGITPRGGRKVYKKEGRPFVRSQNIGWGCLDLDDLVFIDEKTHKSFDATELLRDDVLLNITGASIGRSAIGTDKIVGGNVNQHVCIIRTLKDYIEPEYLNYFLISRSGQDQVASHQAGGNREGLNFGQIGKFKIPTPPTLKEQRAIAGALSDVDALIAALDALIEKKQQVKKGAMQQLLTGKKRLPGFEGEWEEKTLEEIGNTFNGLSGKSGADFGDGNHSYIPFLNVMNNPVIDTDNFDTVKIKAGESQSAAEKGDFFFNTSSETPEEVGMCSVLLENVENLHLNSFCFGFRLFEENEIVPLYLVYYFRSQYGREHMKALAQGSTRYNLSKSKFIRIAIALPSYEEQKAIAGILSDMDVEIQSLQAKRNKYQKIKHGMMQELLTGKTRLISKQENQSEGQDQKKSGHNWQIDEAVLISVLADRFGSKKYPIGRFRRTKLSYLVRRFLASNVDQFLKKAAGPYNHNTRYNGPEKIALDNGYVQEWENGKYSGFIADDNIAEVQEYFVGWHGLDALDWLDNGFRFKKNDDLELLTTVDKSIIELREESKEVSVENVKAVIASHPKWEEKIERDLFSDENIEGAIKQSLELFG